MNRAMQLFPGVVFLWLAGSLAAPASAFTVNLDGTVTDPATGLMWDRCSWGQTGATCSGDGTSTPTWDGALAVAVTANTASHKGYGDWRLPSVIELESLVDITKASGPTINTTAFPNTPSSRFWSSTVDRRGTRRAFYVGFGTGHVLDDLHGGGAVRVRLVRSGQSFDALAPPCGDGLAVDENQWTMLAVPCVPTPPATPASAFETGAPGGLVPGTYNTAAGWALFDWPAHEPTPAYRRLLAWDVLQPGPGYWFYGFPGVFPGGFEGLDVAGTGTPSDVPYGVPGCNSQMGCKAILLHNPGGERVNLVGNPFPQPVPWTAVRVRVNGSGVYTPSEAMTANIMSNQFWVWDGSNYETFNDITPGMEGDLGYFRSFWVRLLNGAAGQTVELLIPAGETLGAIEAPEAVAGGATPWIARWLDWLLPAAQASEPPRGRGRTDPPPGWSRMPEAAPGPARWNAFFEQMTREQEQRGLSRRDAERAAHRRARQEGRQWFVRLKVDDPATGRKDHNNVLGQLLDARDDRDPHDLVAMPPFASPYLSLVFPRPDWGVHAGDYASDYRAADAALPIQWTFEIRSDPPGSEVVLRWEGDPDILMRSRLLDHATGRTVQPTGPQHRNGYPVVLSEGTRTFTWTYLGPIGRGRVPGRNP